MPICGAPLREIRDVPAGRIGARFAKHNICHVKHQKHYKIIKNSKIITTGRRDNMFSYLERRPSLCPQAKLGQGHCVSQFPRTRNHQPSTNPGQVY